MCPVKEKPDYQLAKRRDSLEVLRNVVRLLIRIIREQRSLGHKICKCQQKCHEQ